MYSNDITAEEFENWVNVQHATHCWGGHTERRPVLNNNIEELNLKWLNEFMKNSNPLRTTVQTLHKGNDNRHDDLPGSEFIVGASLIVPEKLDEIMKKYKAIIVTSVDGEPSYSSPDYDCLRVGKGLFSGYALQPGKTRYTLRYSTAVGSDGLCHHVEFGADKPTVIGSHLYFLEDMRKRNSLTKIEPARTSILIHQPK